MKSVFRSQCNPNLLRRFNETFKKDDKGNQRNWPDVEEEQIKELFEKSKAEVALCLDEFRKVVFPRYLTSMETPDAPSESFEVQEFI